MGVHRNFGKGGQAGRGSGGRSGLTDFRLPEMNSEQSGGLYLVS